MCKLHELGFHQHHPIWRADSAWRQLHTLAGKPLDRQGAQCPQAATDDPAACGSLFRRGQLAGHPHNHLADVLCSGQLAQRISRVVKREHRGRQGLDQACKPSRARLSMLHSQHPALQVLL